MNAILTEADTSDSTEKPAGEADDCAETALLQQVSDSGGRIHDGAAPIQFRVQTALDSFGSTVNKLKHLKR